MVDKIIPPCKICTCNTVGGCFINHLIVRNFLSSTLTELVNPKTKVNKVLHFSFAPTVSRACWCSIAHSIISVSFSDSGFTIPFGQTVCRRFRRSALNLQALAFNGLRFTLLNFSIPVSFANCLLASSSIAGLELLAPASVLYAPITLSTLLPLCGLAPD